MERINAKNLSDWACVSCKNGGAERIFRNLCAFSMLMAQRSGSDTFWMRTFLARGLSLDPEQPGQLLARIIGSRDSLNSPVVILAMLAKRVWRPTQRTVGPFLIDSS